MKNLITLIFSLAIILAITNETFAQNVGIGLVTPAYKLDVMGEVASRNTNAFRLRQPDYGVILRNDNANFWLLSTDSGTPDSGWNTLRPFRMELATGDVMMANTQVMFKHTSGNVGIGTLAPTEKLDVEGDIRLGGGDMYSGSGNLRLRGGSGYVELRTTSPSYGVIIRENGSNDFGNIEITAAGLGLGYGTSGAHVTVAPGGNVGIGTSAPTAKLDVQGAAVVNYLAVDPQNATTEGGEISLRGSTAALANWQIDNLSGRLRFHAAGGEWFTMNTAGKASFSAGSTFPGNYRMYVNGGILATRVKVAVYNSAQWADYVFAEDYQLKSLSQVESFIKENKHLPNIPSAKEMVNQGNDLHQTDARLLEKIEELFLHTIEQDKQIELLKKEIESLKEE